MQWLRPPLLKKVEDDRRAAILERWKTHKYLLKCDVVIFFRRHYFWSPKEVQDPDIGYIQLSEEPIMAGRPGFHLRVSNE